MTGEKSMYMLNGLVCFPREPVVKLLFLVTIPIGTFNIYEREVTFKTKTSQVGSYWYRGWRKFGNGLLGIK